MCVTTMRDARPLVHLADAEACAEWADKGLPTKAERAFVTRAGLAGANLMWGDGFGRIFRGTAYPANAYGTNDMMGNVWERAKDWCAVKHQADAAQARGITKNPPAPGKEACVNPRKFEVRSPRKVLKGGLHLRAPSYRRRYLLAARHAHQDDTPMRQIGLRCMMSAGLAT